MIYYDVHLLQLLGKNDKQLEHDASPGKFNIYYITLYASPPPNKDSKYFFGFRFKSILKSSVIVVKLLLECGKLRY